MEIFCYLCNNKTKDWTQNISQIKSKHSGTPVIQYIVQFLGDFLSHRNLYDERNSLCSGCLSRIYAYDWMVLKAKEQEKVLKQVLIATEKMYANRKFVTGDANGEPNKIETVFLNDVKITTATENKVKCEEVVTVPDSPPPPPASTSALESATALPLPMSVQPSLSSQTPIKPVEPVKKGKPIIVRVVKRVPFLKSKPKVPLTLKTPVKEESSVKSTSRSDEGSSKTSSKAERQKSPQKPTKTFEIKPFTCDICEWQFKVYKSFQVSHGVVLVARALFNFTEMDLIFKKNDFFFSIPIIFIFSIHLHLFH